MALPLNSHTNQYVFGRGRLFFSRRNNGVFEGLRFIGNCPGFTLSVTSETFTHRASTAGINTTDLTVTTSVDFGGEITCDDLQTENLALLFAGAESTVTQSATPVTNEAIVVNKGFHYQLGVSSGNPMGVTEVSSVTVTNTAGSTTYVLNTDYALDADSGMIYIIPAGAITNGQTIHVNYTATAGDRELVSSGDTGKIEGELRFIAHNGSGDNRDLRLPLCSLSPNGEIPFITADDIASFSFTIGVSQLNTSTSAVYIGGRLVS